MGDKGKCARCVELAGKVLDLEKRVSYLQGLLAASTQPALLPALADIAHQQQQPRQQPPSREKRPADPRDARPADRPEGTAKRARRPEPQPESEEEAPPAAKRAECPSIDDRDTVKFRQYAISAPADNEWTIEVSNSEKKSVLLRFTPKYSKERAAYYVAFVREGLGGSLGDEWFGRHVSGGRSAVVSYDSHVRRLPEAPLLGVGDKGTVSFNIKAAPLAHKDKKCTHRQGPMVAVVHSKKDVKASNIANTVYSRADGVQVYQSKRETYGKTDLYLGFRRNPADQRLYLRLVELFVYPPAK